MKRKSPREMGRVVDVGSSSGNCSKQSSPTASLMGSAVGLAETKMPHSFPRNK